MHNQPEMEEAEYQQRKDYIKSFIERSVLIRKNAEHVIMSPNGTESGWFFDFRIAFSEKDFLLKVSDLFWHHFDREKCWQVGGLESASLPLIAALVLSGTNTTGFYIRKSRKKKMQMRLIEGRLTNEETILVDDLINSGSSFLKQIAALKKEGRRVSAIFTILRFREENFYDFLVKENIRLITLFTLADFNLSLDDIWQNFFPQKPRWYFAAKDAHFFEQGPKNIPVATDRHLFITADNGSLFKLTLDDGKVVWQKHLVFRKKKSRSTFRSTLLVDDTLFIATYRGALLTIHTERERVALIGSMAQEFSTPLCKFGQYIIAGCSYGIGRNKNFILWYDRLTTKSLEIPVTEDLLPHTAISPTHAYFSSRRHVYALNTQGEICWEKSIELKNISNISIVENKLLVIAMDGSAFFLDFMKGRVLENFQLPAFHFDAPVLEGNKLYGVTLDREIYCFDLAKKELQWTFETKGRMYSRPTLYKKNLYVGDTNGHLHVIDTDTGLRIGSYITAERITNPILVTDKNVIVTTFANELYVFENTLNVQPPKESGPNHPARDLDSSDRV